MRNGFFCKIGISLTFVFIPKEYLGAASLTSLSAPSGLYAPGEGVTNCFGSLGLIWRDGATGSSLPVVEIFKIRFLFHMETKTLNSGFVKVHPYIT